MTWYHADWTWAQRSIVLAVVLVILWLLVVTLVDVRTHRDHGHDPSSGRVA